jgi:PGF-CTERM protein
LLLLVVAAPAVSAGGALQGASADTLGTTTDENIGVTAAEETAIQNDVNPRSAVEPDAEADPACAGHQSTAANGITVVSVQGARFQPKNTKEPARLVAFGPRGEVIWVHDSNDDPGVVWSYDIDPLGNGNIFVTATRRGTTLLYELDTTTGETVWERELPFTDTHDADPINRTHVAIANMRNYDEESGKNNDRILIYDLEDGEIDWEWRFRPHYDRSVGGNYEEDWTHVNDIDKVGDSFLISPRNFDQALLVNKTSGEIDLKLGSDGNHDILHQQHNPDYLESRDGNPTFLVADSENDRIVEYEHADGEWTRTWNVGSSDTLSWPRDADRLRNGHTLIGDSRNHRVMEVTPRGEVVWEIYSPWLVYDVERIPVGGFDSDAYADLGSSRGPTMADLGGTGDYDLSNAAEPETDELERCAATISEHEGGFGSVDLGSTATATPDDTTDGDADDGTSDGSTDSDGTDGDGTDGDTDDGTAGDTSTGDQSTVATTIATTVPDAGSEDGDEDTASGVFTPGFGAVVAVAALLVSALGARRRD